MIKIINYKPINKNTLVGFVDISIPQFGLEIYGCTHFKKGSQEWVSFPQKEYTDKEGVKKYLSIVRFKDRNESDKFSKEALQAIMNFNNASTNPQDGLNLEEDVPF